MFCSNCGKELIEGAKFCTNCGAAVVIKTPAQPVVQQPIQPAFRQDAPVSLVPKDNPEAIGALIMSIISLCFFWIPFINIGCLVLSIIAVKKSSRAMMYANQGYGQKAMSIVGRVLSICALVICALFVLFYTLEFISGFISGFYDGITGEYGSYI